MSAIKNCKLTSGNQNIESRLPEGNIFYSSDFVDVVEMAKAVHSQLKNGEYKFGRASCGGTGIFLGCRGTENFGSYIYMDYFQSKLRVIKCNNGSWSEVQ